MTFLWTECTRGCAPPRVCVRAGECLCDAGLSEKSRLVEFVFCSLYTSSQLRDMTDKSTPPLPPHLPLLVSSFLFLLLCVSSLSPLPFTLLGWGWLFYWKWPSSDVNFLTTSSPPLQQSPKPKGQFFFFLFFLHLSSAKPKCTLYTWGFKSKITFFFFFPINFAMRISWNQKYILLSSLL